ncbi:MAG: hypothetical protein ACFFAN_04445 [Promethearchaeota archaeon]
MIKNKKILTYFFIFMFTFLSGSQIVMAKEQHNNEKCNLCEYEGEYRIFFFLQLIAIDIVLSFIPIVSIIITISSKKVIAQI